MEGRSFDDVIVGAGSSGCALAGRLSEDPETTVLLLEAGPDFRASACPPEMLSANPLSMNDPIRFPDHCWPRLTARRTSHQAPRRYDRGRGAGGSSAINYQVAFRGTPDDYDRWAAQWATGWAYDDVLPYVRRLEDGHDFGDTPHHGRGGPAPIERKRVSQWGKTDLALVEGALDLGYPWTPDHDAPCPGGIGPYAANPRPPYNEPPFKWDSTRNPVRTDLLAEPFALSAGAIRVPTGAGLGVALNDDALRRYLTAGWVVE